MMVLQHRLKYSEMQNNATKQQQTTIKLNSLKKPQQKQKQQPCKIKPRKHCHDTTA